MFLFRLVFSSSFLGAEVAEGETELKDERCTFFFSAIPFLFVQLLFFSELASCNSSILSYIYSALFHFLFSLPAWGSKG